jgi:hypothetical protein
MAMDSKLDASDRDHELAIDVRQDGITLCHLGLVLTEVISHESRTGI